jgi:hypothetical protein
MVPWRSPNRAQGGLEPAEVRRLGAPEEIDVLRRAHDDMQVHGHVAHEDVLDLRALERSSARTTPRNTEKSISRS